MHVSLIKGHAYARIIKGHAYACIIKGHAYACIIKGHAYACIIKGHVHLKVCNILQGLYFCIFIEMIIIPEAMLENLHNINGEAIYHCSYNTL